MLKYFLPLLLIASPIAAAAQEQAPDQTYEAEIKRASQLGLLLYEFDSSAWVATDALRDKKKAWELYTEIATPKGWTTTEVDKNRLRTAFIAELNGELVSVFDAETKGRKVKKKTTYPTGRQLTESELMQYHAKRAFTAKDIEPCAEFLPMNAAVIPSPDGGAPYLYLMSATKKPNLVVLGRHFRFRVSEDGKSLSEKTGFTNGCIGLPMGPSTEGKPAGLLITHLRAPHPQEHHVFASLANDIPLFVTMPKTGTTWKVDGTSIKPIDAKKLGQ